MSGLVTPEAGEMLMLMADEVVLPSDWDVSGVWLNAAQNLARFLVDHKDRLYIDGAALLVVIGGMLIVMAKREREASVTTDAFFNGEGGAK
ncbi:MULTISPECIES: hypothetical protein [unclassified Sphingomonas]|uniref:hypothetical protein n=1 Tax=unclassified Sphingomonas TaxID=196159 RepID=UPI0006F6615B|nr:MULTISPECIES: hypothetical protein [unclassified Sphingomonas]KQM28753.1 hypothetical protein ASE58_02490 [Sphingomonas sp. Leaf9]KQM45456.1 hypothetical protein ASE57_02485 [Sphingomonas sp. Leaf11]